MYPMREAQLNKLPHYYIIVTAPRLETNEELIAK